MRISGTMLKEKWQENGDIVYENDVPDVYFTSIRVLDGQSTVLDDYVLYVQGEQVQGTAFRDNERAGIFCLKKPEKCSKTKLFWTDTVYTETQILNHILRIVQLYESWYEGLQRCLRSEMALQQTVDYLYRTLGNPCYIADMRFRVLAMNQSNPDLFLYSLHWKQIGELGYLPYDVVSSIIENPQWKAIRTSHRPVLAATREFSTPFLTCNLRSRGKIVRQLFLCEIEKKISRADEDCMGIAAELLEEQLTSHTDHGHAEGEFYEYIFRDVLSGKIRDSVFMDRQLAPLHWKVQGMYCLLEIEKQVQETYVYERFASICSEQLGGRPVLYKDRCMAVFCVEKATDFSELKEKISIFLQEQRCRGALSDVYTGFLKLTEAVRWTEAVLQQRGSDTGQPCKGRLWLCRDHILEVLLTHPAWADRGVYKGLDIVRSLQSFDRLHHSDYVHTLRLYLEQQCNLVRASKALHIHRNTLVYRLEKLQEMLPESLENESYRFLLQLTLEMEQTLAEIAKGKC